MASAKTNSVYDTVQQQYAGMNGNIESSILSDNQYLKGINVTCRGGIIRTRPGFDSIPLSFNSTDDERIFKYGKWQGAATYQGLYETMIISAVSGNVFMISPATGRVGNVTSVTGRFNQYQDRLYFCQVEGYMIVQDGINTPIIILEKTAAKADSSKQNQVPVGTIMAYGHGRLFIKVSANQFVAGNINMPTVPINVLQFTETTYLQGGGAFGIPSDLGEITGMAFTQNFTTGDGQGSLIVFCKNGFDAFNVATPRSYWSDSDISQVQGRGIGCASHDGIVITGDDMIFRTFDGIGSFDLFKTSDRRWTDLAAEMLPFEQQETPWCRTLSSGVFFDNRVLFTMVAEKVDCLDLDGTTIADYRFKALGVLDLAPLNGLSQIGEQKLAVWDGAWTGPNPLQILTGNFDSESKCFAFGKSDAGENILYELGIQPGYDCVDKPINCRFYPRYFRGFDFIGATERPNEMYYSYKHLQDVSLFVSKFENDVEFKLWVRPDSRCDFTQISQMTIHSPMVACEAPYIDLQSGQWQGRAKLYFPQFKDRLGDLAQGLNLLDAYEYEFCIEWNGLAEVRKVVFGATSQEKSKSAAPDRNVLQPLNERSDFDYSISCPIYVMRTSNVIVPWIIITLGEFNSWSIPNIPGVIVTDENGVVIPPDTPQTESPAQLTFYQDPATSPDWSTTPGGPGGSSGYLTQIPNPPVTRNNGTTQTTQDPGNVTVNPLPKPSDPPSSILGVTLDMTLPGLPYSKEVPYPLIVERDVEFTTRLRLFKHITVKGLEYYEPWTNLPSTMTITLSLGAANVNDADGDTYEPWTTNDAVWNADGSIEIIGMVSDGSTNPNPTSFVCTITNGDKTYTAQIAIVIEAEGISVEPMSDEMDFVVGGDDQTFDITVTNENQDSSVIWSAELVNIDPAITDISIDNTGGTLDGGDDDTMTVTCGAPASAGTYTATIRFSSDANEKTYDVVLTVVMVVNPTNVLTFSKAVNKCGYDYITKASTFPEYTIADRPPVLSAALANLQTVAWSIGGSAASDYADTSWTLSVFTGIWGLGVSVQCGGGMYSTASFIGQIMTSAKVNLTRCDRACKIGFIASASGTMPDNLLSTAQAAPYISVSGTGQTTAGLSAPLTLSNWLLIVIYFDDWTPPDGDRYYPDYAEVQAKSDGSLTIGI